MWAANKAALALNCALRSNNAKTPAAKAKSAAAAKAAQAAAATPSSSSRSSGDKAPGSAAASGKKKVQTDEAAGAARQVCVWEQKGGWAVVCKELLGKLLKNKRVWPFENPVDAKALKLGDYKKIVKKPMDLGTVGTKLEEGKYTDLEQSGEEFYKDVVLTFDNALLYNNEGDEIWEHAASLKATFEELWSKVLEPAKGGQGAGSAKAPTPGAADKASALKSDAASQSWHDWAAGMVRKMVKAGYSKGLREPLNAKAMGLSDYNRKIKKPMDLGTVEGKLQGKEYSSLVAFAADVRLVAANAVQYFDDDHALHKQGVKLLGVLEDELQAFQRQMQDVEPKAKTPAGEHTHKGKETPGAAEGALKNGQECPLGTQVRMLFDDGVWYLGTVTKFDARSKKYSVEFQDGEVQETKIPDDDVQIVPHGKGGSSSKGAGKPTQSESSGEVTPGAATKTPSGAADNLKSGQEYALGTKVRMLFDDGVWYPGTLVKFDGRSQKYAVEFEDGDTQETKIPDKDVEVVLLQVQGHDRSTSAGKAAKRARTSLPGDEETESKCSSKKTSKSSAKGGAGEELCKDAGAGQAPASRGKSGGSGGSAVAARGGAGENAVAAASSDKAAASAGTKRSVSVRASERTL